MRRKNKIKGDKNNENALGIILNAWLKMVRNEKGKIFFMMTVGQRKKRGSREKRNKMNYHAHAVRSSYG